VPGKEAPWSKCGCRVAKLANSVSYVPRRGFPPIQSNVPAAARPEQLALVFGVVGRWRESLTTKAHNAASNSNPTKGNNETEQEAGREAGNDCLRVKSGLPLAWAEPPLPVRLLRKHSATATPPSTPGLQHCSAIWRSLESTPPPPARKTEPHRSTRDR